LKDEGGRKKEKWWMMDFGFWVNFRQDLQEGGEEKAEIGKVKSEK
jgi:hypothetical protein